MLRPDGIRLISLARPPVNAIDFAFVRAIGDAPHDAAVARAASLAAAPAYATIKRQLEAAAVRRLERIVAEDSDPLLGMCRDFPAA